MSYIIIYFPIGKVQDVEELKSKLRCQLDNKHWVSLKRNYGVKMVWNLQSEFVSVQVCKCVGYRSCVVCVCHGFFKTKIVTIVPRTEITVIAIAIIFSNFISLSCLSCRWLSCAMFSFSELFKLSKLVLDFVACSLNLSETVLLKISLELFTCLVND